MKSYFHMRVLAFATCTFLGANLFAQDPETCPTSSSTSKPSPIPLSLTLSGGVSLGAYQAGFLYYSGQVLKLNPKLFEPKIITGSSAGGINTLLSIFSLCSGDVPDPTQSALWQSWIELNTRELLIPTLDHRALLSREAFTKIAENIRKLWFDGLPKTCDIVIGVPATRLSPETKMVWSELGLGRQAEKFTLRIQGRGLKTPPLLTNYVNAVNGEGQNILALKSNDSNQNFNALRDLMFATTAFPIVFAPQKLSYCVADSKSERWLHTDYPLTCLPSEIETAEFVDGGLFDNQPIGFADQISRIGLFQKNSETNHCGHSKWREIPLLNSEAPQSNDSVLYMYLDNDLHEYPVEKPVEDQKYLLPYFGSFLNQFLNSSQRKDVLSSFEQNPSLKLQVAVAKNFYPRISDHMFGFFGFLEKDFRKFDFYLGMQEAHEYFRNQIRATLQSGSKLAAKDLIFPEDSPKYSNDWEPLFCLCQTLNSSEKAQNKTSAKDSNRYLESCKNIEPHFKKNFEILANLAKERLGALCATYASQKKPESACLQVNSKSETYLENESDFGFTLRKLSQSEFQFKDLGLTQNQAVVAGAKMKTTILDTIDRLASSQRWPDDLAVSTLGPIAINAIERLPTERDGFIALGPALKAGLSNLLSTKNDYPPRLRMTAEVQIASINSWLGGGGVVVPSLLAGLEYEVGSLSSKLLQTRLRLLVGYQFHSGFHSAENICLDNAISSLDCRGGFLEPGLSVTFLERFRLQIDGQWFVFNTLGEHKLSVIPTLGLQFYF